ncbi:d-galactonate transporter [Klebsiella aerogenes]|nr:d-galactonate transporter [Klebsiella aerogenes]
MRKIKGLRWYMIALVTLGTVLGYLTRNTVAAAAPTLMEELHISTQQYSYIIAAYSAAYTVMQPVAGYVLDILGTKIGYAFFAIAWAVFCGSTALAGSWGGLALARGAVGAAEAAMIPAGLKASSEWFPAKERSIAVGYFNVGSSIGAMIAPPLVVWAIVMHSWQMAFIISGVLSFAWAIAWLIFYKHPRDQKNYLTKNVTTSLAVRSLSIRPITRRKCRRGKSCATVSSGVSPCRASSPSRPGGPLTPGSRCSCSKFTVLT